MPCTCVGGRASENIPPLTLRYCLAFLYNMPSFIGTLGLDICICIHILLISYRTIGTESLSKRRLRAIGEFSKICNVVLADLSRDELVRAHLYLLNVEISSRQYRFRSQATMRNAPSILVN